MRDDWANGFGQARSSATESDNAGVGWPREVQPSDRVRPNFRPRLESLSVRGFCSIELARDLRFGSTNVLIGANGSGKSTFLNVLSFLRLVSRGRLRYFVQKVGGADSVLHFGRDYTPAMDIHLTFRCGGRRGEYSLQLEATPNDFLTPTQECILFGDEDRLDLQRACSKHDSYERRDPYEAGLSLRRPMKERHFGLSALQRLLEGCQVYQFCDVGPDSALTLNPALSDRRSLHADGGNLASYLFRLRRRHTHSYELIRHTVRQVAPCFEDFVLEPDTGDTDTVRLRWKFRDRDRVMDVSALSGGVLRFVALATLLLQPRQLMPSIVLLDEPEMGLDHLALRVLGDMIEAVSRRRQVLVATQSAVLLDALSPENVLVTELRNGATHIGRVELDGSDLPRSDFPLGELWQKDGFGRYLVNG